LEDFEQFFQKVLETERQANKQIQPTQ